MRKRAWFVLVWAALARAQPVPLKVELRLVESQVYREGEAIRMEARFPQSGWQLTGFRVEPEPAGCGSLANLCFSAFSFMYPPTEGTAAFALNEYVPALRPGHYRVAAVLSGPGPGQEAISNPIELDVRVAEPGWVQSELTAIRGALQVAEALSANGEASEARQRAAMRLRFLDQEAAWRTALDVLPVEESILLGGLFNTRQPAEVCELLQARLTEPQQTVSLFYFSTLAETCARAHLPAPPPALLRQGRTRAVFRISQTPSPPLGASLVGLDPEVAAYMAKRQSYVSNLQAKTAATLAASLGKKLTEPKFQAISTLLAYLQMEQPKEPPTARPSWAPAVMQELLHIFPGLDGGSQRVLLDMFARVAAPGELVPLLESTLDAWKPGRSPEMAQEAFRWLSRRDRARALARMVAELAKPGTWLDNRLLALVPSDEVTPMDDTLLTAAAGVSRLGAEALARFATPQALPRVKALYEGQRDECQPELTGYFVRVDPSYAERIFKRQVWNMQTPPSGCTLQYFQVTAPLAMHPVFESYLAAYLKHSLVFVKLVAAQSLGKHGSLSAKPPLWEAYRYFHEYWKGKQSQLEQNGEGVVLEVELRSAIARARNWLATEAELREIEALCISRQCVAETQADLRARQSPIELQLHDGSEGIQFRVGNYVGIEGPAAAIRARLALYPRGTEFKLRAVGLESQRAAIQIRRFAEERGLVFREFSQGR